MDRRTFLKGGLVVAGSTFAAGALGGCAAKGSSAAAKESEAATAAEWYGSPLDVSTLDIAETVETEILVCGAGSGGIMATAVAAKEGAKVVCIEKGGSSGSMKTYVGVVGSRIDEAAGVSVDKMAVLNEFTRYTNGWCDPRVARVWVNESGEAFDWICDAVAEFGVTPYFETDTGGAYHGCWPVYPLQHGFSYSYTDEEMAAAQEKVGDNADPSAMVQALPKASTYLLQKAVEWGADVRYLTALVQLERDDDGRVTGAIADNNGSYVRINASKGVILATGGYEADPDLLAQLNPDAASIGGVSMAQMGCVGDGIKAGLWAGGVKDEIPTLMTFARAAVAPDVELGYPYAGTSCWMGDQPFLKVNMRGERVCCESSPYDYPLFVGTAHPGHKLASIWDANYQEHIKAFHTIGCSRIAPSETLTPEGNPNGEGLTFEANDGMIFQAIENGIIQQADTLEELAEKLLMSADALKATVARYNELCERGVDEDFGKESKDMLALGTPPYFGAYFGGHVLCTLDGLKIDEHARVIDEAREPIEGLYAVGNCSGSLFAGSYPELLIGSANGRTITFGRHAVLHILGKA